jgi:hypothetical protein
MPRDNRDKIKNMIHATVARVNPTAANGAAHGARSANVSAWIGSTFMVCCNVTHACDDQPPKLHNDHCRVTDTAVAKPAMINNAPADNQAASSDLVWRTSRADSTVMLLPGTKRLVPSE